MFVQSEKFVESGAFKILGDQTLQQIARELVQSVKQNVTIDWSIREKC
jgi:type I restriction enzyme R subunit